MTNLLFRELTREDEPFLWEMLYHAIHVPEDCEPLPRSIIQSDELRRYVEGWGEPTDEGLLAVDTDHPVGAIWLRMLTGAKAGYGFVDASTPELSISVLPEYRGRGIGTQLLRRLLASTANRHHAISLSVSADNPAVRLYERLGFTVTAASESSLTMIRTHVT